MISAATASASACIYINIWLNTIVSSRLWVVMLTRRESIVFRPLPNGNVYVLNSFRPEHTGHEISIKTLSALLEDVRNLQVDIFHSLEINETNAHMGATIWESNPHYEENVSDVRVQVLVKMDYEFGLSCFIQWFKRTMNTCPKGQDKVYWQAGTFLVWNIADEFPTAAELIDLFE